MAVLSWALLYWGTTEAAIAFQQRLQKSPYLGLKLVAWFSPTAPLPHQPLPPGMPTWGGGLRELRAWLDHHSVDQIVFSHISSDQLSMADLLRFLGDTCIPVTYAPGWVMPGMRFEVEQVADQPCIDLWPPINPASTPASNACLIWPWRSAGPAPGHPPRSAHHATRCGDAPLEPR